MLFLFFRLFSSLRFFLSLDPPPPPLFVFFFYFMLSRGQAEDMIEKGELDGDEGKEFVEDLQVCDLFLPKYSSTMLFGFGAQTCFGGRLCCTLVSAPAMILLSTGKQV